MKPNFAHRAAERKQQDAVPQPELHGAATPAPLPSESEPPPAALPLPDVAPDQTETKSDRPPVPPQPSAKRWESIFFLETESPDDFSAFYERLDDHYMPYNEEERVCVAKLAEARWMLARRKRVIERLEAELYAGSPNPSEWTEADFKRLAIADAYRLRAEKVVLLTQRDVEAFVKERLEDSKWQTNRDLAERRLQLQRQKFAWTLQQAGVGDKQAAAKA